MSPTIDVASSGGTYGLIHLGEPVSATGGIVEEKTIELLIVEDHAVVADALSDALGRVSDIEVMGAAEGIAAMVEVLDGSPCPDVVLLDMWLPDGDGAQAATRARSICPDVAVLFLTASDSIEAVARAVRAGASGFLTKGEPLTTVVAAIRDVQAGRVLFDPATLSRVADHLSRAGSDGDDLTGREREVLQLLAHGASTAMIAQRLVISPHTVRSHVRNLLGKLGAHSKLEGVAIAIQKGLVDTAPPN